jgi:prepilin-type N-terminal cleavage/methylation domain-containing protein
MPSRARLSDQRGFTLVEVLVAIVILMVGILGVVTLVDGANAVTSKTRAREAGTNLARSVIEVSRSIRYRDLTNASLEDALLARPGLTDSKPALAGYQILSRGVTYTATLTVCSLDDAKDDLGDHVAGVTYCADSDVLPAGGTSRDRNPDDYKRVRVKLVWKTRNTEQSVTQTSSIINPVGGLGPSVTGLTMISPSSSSVDPPLRIDSAVNSANFRAQTSTFAAEVTWSVGGEAQGKANGGPTSWDFTWNFLNPDGSIAYYDCTYVVQADAFDNQARAGAPRAVSVVLNRALALPVADLQGGRNGNGNLVDLQWTKNHGECDVVGYRVFRGTSPDQATMVQITCLNQDQPTYTSQPRCIDDTAAAGVTYYYRVRGVDTLGTSTLRSGDWSAPLTANSTPNAVPSKPGGVTSCVGGQVGCNDPNGQPAPNDVVVVRWNASTDSDGTVSFYRIYRDGAAYSNRHDVFFPGGGGLAWMEFAQPDGQQHTYRVSAVDNGFGESALSDPVVAP